MQISFLGTKINTLFYNDSHGSVAYLDSFLKAQNEFYKQNPNSINLTMSGGDVFITTNPNNETIAKKLCTNADAVGLGNHDIEGGEHIAHLIQKYALKGKMLAANLLFKRKCEMQDEILASTIIEKNGEKFGVIGISPFEFRELCFSTKQNDFFEVKPFAETFEIVEQEVKKLQKQGIDKIFLLAHTGQSTELGIDYYNMFAQIDGIDVIIGGHDHLEVDRWAKSESGEPVKIVATGKNQGNDFRENLNMYGILELDFDDNGVLIEKNTKTSFKTLKEVQEALDTTPIVATIEQPLMKGNILLGHSEVGNIVADSNLWYVNSNTKTQKADFAFVNAGTIRANLNQKEVSEKDIQEVVPFVSQRLIKTTLTKKQVIDTLNWCSRSSTFKKVTPGVMQVANMTYTINPDTTVSNVKVLNDDGSVKYYIDELEDDFEFTVVYDDFLATGVAGLVDLIKDVDNDNSIEIYDVTRQMALKDYLINGEIKDCKTPRITNLINY